MIESLEALARLMVQGGAARIYAKRLAPNDNSKNQVYLGGDFSALNIIPHGVIETDDSDLAGSVRDRAKASVRFSWIDEHGEYEAPDAKLILYPKYPEVRMSGFLKGCGMAPKGIMTVRDEGRVLFIGVTRDGRVLAHAVVSDSPLAQEIGAREDLTRIGVFLQFPAVRGAGSNKERLLSELERWSR